MYTKPEKYWQFWIKNEYGSERISLEAYIHRIFGMRIGGAIVRFNRWRCGYKSI